MDNTSGPKGSSIASVFLQPASDTTDSPGPIAAPAKQEGSAQPANPEFMIQAAQKQATERASMQNLAGEMQKTLLQSKVKSDQTASRPTESAPAPAKPYLTPTEKAINKALDAFDEQTKKVKDLKAQLKTAPYMIKPALEKALAKEEDKLDHLAEKLDQLIKMRQNEKDIEKFYADRKSQILQNIR